MGIRDIVNSPEWVRMTSEQRMTLLESLTYVQYGKTLTAVINYNYIVFYSLDNQFVLAMGAFLPTIADDLDDRSISVKVSPVQWLLISTF